MLIAIFALLLVSVVAIALIVSSGTDTSLAGNYRTSTSAYYAGLAGLEEGRGRLSWRNPGFINNAVANFLPLQPPTSSPPTGPTQLLYLVNPSNGETVAPLGSNPATYPDLEYSREFGSSPDPNAPVISSTFATATVPGPLYKWVRITPATESSLAIDVCPDGTIDFSKPVFFDPTHSTPLTGPKPSLIVPGSSCTPLSPLPPAARQVLEITALAVLPNNTQKLVQYVVYPSSLTMTFPAALTLVGKGVSYAGPSSASFNINGNDPTMGRTCSTPPASPVFAIGYTYASDNAAVLNGTNSNPSLYTGAVPLPPATPTPSIGVASFPPNLQTVNNWESVLQFIHQNYDVYLEPIAPATSVPGSALPSSSVMTNANPMTVFVDGDLDLTGWHQTGYGLLVVTGKLIYDPDASWEGVVLVIGKGTVTAPNHSGSGRIDGAILVAKTRGANGVVLPGPDLGASSVSYDPNVGGVGIYYNSCWISAALQPTSYKILSFREIPYP